jgi:hypothetical protein
MKPVLLLIVMAVSVLADTQFRAARMTADDVPLGKGRCEIRLQIDKEAEVQIRHDSVFVRTISGREARDDGSECNEPLPQYGITGFNFEVRDSRGEIILLSPPSRRNEYTAVVRIRDSASGTGRYHFRLSWNIAGYDPERVRQPSKGLATQQGVQVCQEAVVSRIVDRYHYGDVSIRNIRADDHPGRRNYLLGEASARRGFREVGFTFVCVVDFNSGRVGWMDVRKR